MTEQNLSGQPVEDTEGHMPRVLSDAERVEGDDVEGHMPRVGGADAERIEGDDVEGHMPRS